MLRKALIVLFSSLAACSAVAQTTSQQQLQQAVNDLAQFSQSALGSTGYVLQLDESCLLAGKPSCISQITEAGEPLPLYIRHQLETQADKVVIRSQLRMQEPALGLPLRLSMTYRHDGKRLGELLIDPYVHIDGSLRITVLPGQIAFTTADPAWQNVTTNGSWDGLIMQQGQQLLNIGKISLDGDVKNVAGNWLGDGNISFSKLLLAEQGETNQIGSVAFNSRLQLTDKGERIQQLIAIEAKDVELQGLEQVPENTLVIDRVVLDATLLDADSAAVAELTALNNQVVNLQALEPAQQSQMVDAFLQLLEKGYRMQINQLAVHSEGIKADLSASLALHQPQPSKLQAPDPAIWLGSAKAEAGLHVDRAALSHEVFQPLLIPLMQTGQLRLDPNTERLGVTLAVEQGILSVNGEPLLDLRQVPQLQQGLQEGALLMVALLALRAE